MSDKLSATIEVGLDGSKVQQGVAPITRTIDNLAKAAKRAGDETSESMKGIGDAGAASASKIDRSTNNMISAIQRTTVAMEAGSKTSAKYFEVLAQQRGINADTLRPYLDQLRAVENAQKSVGISAAQTAAAMRSVPAQFTDIVTSLQGGQQPLTVLLQQGGQLKDMFGGVGNAAKAMGSYIVGLINPLTVSAAAVAGLAYVYSQANEQSKAFAKSIITSGNAAGATVDQLNAAARRLSDVGVGSQSAAAEALNALVSSGDVSMSMLDQAARVAIRNQELLGISVKDTVKAFSDLAGDPTKAIESLNDKYHFLTLELYEQIKALQDQGKKAEAAALAQQAYADALNGQADKVNKTLSDWERGWIRIKNAVSSAYDSTKQFFADDTAQTELDKLLKERDKLEASQKRLANDTSWINQGAAERVQKLLDQNKALINLARDKISADERAAKAEEAKNKQVQAGIQWAGIVEKNLSKQQKLELEIAKARNVGIAAGKSQAEIEKEVATIRENGAEKSKKATEDQSLAWQVAKAEAKAWGKAQKEINEELIKSHTSFADVVKKNTKEIIADFNSQWQAENRLKDSLDDWARGYQESADLAKLELSLLGQSSVERATAVAQFKIQLDLQKQLAQIERERAANKISDAGAEEAKLKAQQIAADAKNLAGIKAQQDEWTKFYNDIYNGLSDSLYRGFESGKGFFKSFWDGIKNLFKTTVLKLAIQGVVGGVMGGLVGNANAATLQNPFTSTANLISAGKSLWDGFTSAGTLGNGFWGSLAGGLNGAGAGSGLASSTGLELGNYLQGLLGNSAASTLSTGISAVSSAMPYLALYQASKAINGNYTLNGMSKDVGALFGIAPRLFGMSDKQMTGQTITGSLGTDNLTRNVAWTQSGGIFRADRSDTWRYRLKDSIATTSDGKQYQDAANVANDSAMLKYLNDSYAALKASTADFAKALGINADEVAKRNDALNITLGATKEETDKAIAAAFSGIADTIASSLIPSIDSLRKEGETSSTALARLASGLVSVNQTIAAIGLDKLASSIDGAGAAQRLVDLSGGIEKFTSGAAFFAENFLSEAEKIKPATDLVAETMARLGQSSVDTIPEFKNLVQSLDLSTESGAKMYAELIAIAPQFKAVADYTTNLNGALVETAEALKSAADIARERASLEDQLNALTDTAAQALARQRAALDESNRGLFDQIQAIKEKQDAEQQFAAIQKASNDERLSLLGQLNELTMTNEQRLQAQRFALDQTNVAIFDQIQAVKAQQKAEEEAAQKAAAVAQERANLQSQLNALTDTAVQALARQREALDESNRAIFDQIEAVKARQQAEEAAAQRAAQVAQERAALQDQLAALSGDATDALARQRAALDESNRGIFDQIQALTAQKAAEEEAARVRKQTEEDAAKAREAAAQLAAQKVAAIEQERAGLQDRLNALTDTAAQALERQRAALDASNQGIFDQIQALQAQKAAEEAAAQRAAQVAQERAGLQDQLNALTDSAAQALARQRAALDESNRGIFDQIQALSQQRKAEEEAAQQAAQVAQERNALQERLSALTETAAQATERQRNALDESNRAIFDQVKALEAQKAAEEAAAQKAAQIAQERAGLQDQLNALTDTAAQALARQREALDESNRAIFDQIQALNEQKQAEALAAQKAEQIANERTALQDQLNGLTDTAAQALARQREALDESNRGIFDQIQAIRNQQQAAEEAKQATQNALDAVSKAIDAERTRVAVVKQAAQESVNSIKSIFGVLGDQIDSIYSSVDSTKALQAIAGNEFLDNALANAKATGYLPEQDQLAKAIAAIRTGISSTEYATQFEADKAALVMAGKLSQLQAIAEPQLTAAERALELANQQLEALDAQEALAKQQVDAINGVNNSVLSVEAALSNLAGAIQARTPTTTPLPLAAASTIFDAPQTAVASTQSSRLESLVEALTAEVAELKEHAAATATNTRRSNDYLSGNQAPIPVQIV